MWAGYEKYRKAVVIAGWDSKDDPIRLLLICLKQFQKQFSVRLITEADEIDMRWQNIFTDNPEGYGGA